MNALVNAAIPYLLHSAEIEQRRKQELARLRELEEALRYFDQIR
jgi:hypothetical protein